MLSGKEFLGFCQKLSSIIWRSWLFEFPHFFLSGFFLPAVISWLYFITFWDLAFKHLEMYLFSQCKKQTTTTKLLEFWRTLLIIWHCTVNILCASKNLLLQGYPGVASVDNAFIFLFISFLSASFLLFFLTSLSLLSPSFPFFLLRCSVLSFLPYFLPLFWVSSFFIQIWKLQIIYLKVQYLWKRVFKKQSLFLVPDFEQNRMKLQRRQFH